MKLHGWLAAREFGFEFWRSRENVAIYLASSLAWFAFAGGAAWASRATGLGDTWSLWHQMIAWAGAATQIFIGCALPLSAAVEDGRAHMEYGSGCCEPAGFEAKNTRIAFCVGLWVVFLVSARFSGPWAQTWSPEWLSLVVSQWWIFVDALSAVVAILLWLSVGFEALAHMIRSSRTVSEKRWFQIEHDQIGRVSKSGKKRGFGPQGFKGNIFKPLVFG